MRTNQGFYLSSDVERTSVEQRIAEAAATLVDGGAVTGWASLRMYGDAFADGLHNDGVTPRAVELRVPPGSGCSPYDGIVHVQGHPWESVEILGVRCVRVVPALFDAMRLRRNVRDAVVDVDMALAAGLLTIEEMQAFLDHRRSWRGVRGVRQARAALGLAHPNSASPPETRLRLVWVLDGQFPTPRVNEPVLDLSGRLLGYPDLFDEVAGLAIEYDGAYHDSEEQRRDDEKRELAFRRVHVDVLRVVRGELTNRDALVGRLRRARSVAPFEPPHERRWVIGLRPEPGTLFGPFRL